MRRCQVDDEADLPAVYSQLANAPKGQQHRVLQAAIDQACERLQYQHLNLQITTSLSKKIVELDWQAHIQDDLSTGLHHFTVGYVTEEEAESQRLRNREADLLQSGGATPSLSDTQLLLADPDVHVAVTILQGRVSHQRMYALWDALLGTIHPLTMAQRDFCALYLTREIELEGLKPRDTSHYFIVPALLMRRPQLEISYWIRQQSRSDDVLPAPTLGLMFDNIAQGKDWAPTFASRYLNQLREVPTSDQSLVSGMTPSDRTRDSPWVSSTAPTVDTEASGANGRRKNKVTARWRAYFELNYATKRVKVYYTEASIKLPYNKVKQSNFCLSWHIRGQCNMVCGSKGDYFDHTTAEADELEAWVKANYKVPTKTSSSA